MIFRLVWYKWLCFGDLYQLPPVVAEDALHQYFAHNHGGPYFFNADVWQKTKLHTFELTHIFRQQEDEGFKLILNSVRNNQIEESTLLSLNERYVEAVPTENVVTLAARNDVADRINNRKLALIEEPLFEYKAEVSGNLDRSAFPLKNSFVSKKGAQVMLLKNDPEKRWVNGTVWSNRFALAK